MPSLRDYQQDSVMAILAAWADGDQRPSVILPTGSGKTVIFGALCTVLARRGQHALILVNRDELVQQTVNKLRDADATMRVGVIQGPRNELNGTVTIASVQTLSRARRLAQIQPGRFNRIICDEAHFSDSPSWRRVLEHFGAFDPESACKAVGFTATMARTGKHRLGEIWSEPCFERSTRWAVEEGHLVRPVAKTVVLPDLDLRGVRTRHGDLADGDLGKAMSDAKAGPLIAAAYHEHARDAEGELRRGILFAPTVETAISFMADFRAAGIPTELVIGETPITERQRVYELTRQGINKVISSVGVLTTGFDLPAVEVAVMARPTKARHLYQQMAGRVMRLSPGKDDCLLLDCVGVSRFGLASIVDLRIDDQPDQPGDDSDPLLRGPLQDAHGADTPDSVGFRDIDAISGGALNEDPAVTKLRRSIMRRKATRFWSFTKGATPFLPPTLNFRSAVFLYEVSEACWSVGELPHGKPVSWVASCLPYIEAVDAALAAYPSPPTLDGPATPGQQDLLARFGITAGPFLTKAEASTQINIEVVSRRLDKVDLAASHAAAFPDSLTAEPSHARMTP